ncbi:hypothetical protein HZA33_04250 [Candidatus Pacearchaeota archaeon]|nr:hypothetical protein [Candidatus Pacearchaeota archaeon]
MTEDLELKRKEEERMNSLVVKVQTEFFPELHKRKFYVRERYMLPKNILTVNRYDEINFDPFILYLPEKAIMGAIGHELSHALKKHLTLSFFLPFPFDLLVRGTLERKADEETERRGLSEHLDLFKNQDDKKYYLSAFKEYSARRKKER